MKNMSHHHFLMAESSDFFLVPVARGRGGTSVARSPTLAELVGGPGPGRQRRPGLPAVAVGCRILGAQVATDGWLVLHNVNPGLIKPVYGCLVGRVPFKYHYWRSTPPNE